LLPKFFGYKNSYDAPFWSLLVSCIGIIPLLIMTANKNLVLQVLTIIDFSVSAFLFVYAFCSVAFLKILFQKKDTISNKLPMIFYGFSALAFCLWVIYETPLYTLAIASLFTMSGLPFYLYFQLKKRKVS
jgi:basic amino acid/polyamine antiporter, APA family